MCAKGRYDRYTFNESGIDVIPLNSTELSIFRILCFIIKQYYMADNHMEINKSIFIIGTAQQYINFTDDVVVFIIYNSSSNTFEGNNLEININYRVILTNK